MGHVQANATRASGNDDIFIHSVHLISYFLMGTVLKDW